MSQSTLLAGSEFHDRYHIVRAIRSGGMGEVYRAVDRSSGMPVAIKRMLVDSPSDGSNESAAYQAQRFEEECKLLQNLSVPGIPAFVDSFLDGDRRVIVMEFIEGVDLEKQVMDQLALAGTDLPPLLAVQYTIQVAKILEFLHAHRPRPIIHRDVKPANIIVRHQDSRIYLVDFGLAREVGGGASTKTAVGTVGYAPIEQYRGRPTTRTDQYSLGVTLHFMLSGQQPLPLQIEPLDTIRKDLPHELCWVVRKATQSAQEDRFDSVYDFRRQLENLLPQLEQLQKNRELQSQAQDRLQLLGPTEELQQEERPTQRVKIEGIHREAEDPLKDFGLYDPLRDSVSVQKDFQRQAIQAESQQRMGGVVLDDHRDGKGQKTMFTLLMFLLVVGLVSLYFLNLKQQKQLAAQVAPAGSVLEAHGFFRQGDRIGLGRGGMGAVENLLSLPHPAHDGFLTSLPKGTRAVNFTRVSEEMPFLAASMDRQSLVKNSKWFKFEKGAWREAVSPFKGLHLNFDAKLDAPTSGWMRSSGALEVRGGSQLLLITPGESDSPPLYFF
ncbi:MAG: serine/threonine-protein kinase [Vulcanimicrobiota bacterium]